MRRRIEEAVGDGVEAGAEEEFLLPEVLAPGVVLGLDDFGEAADVAEGGDDDEMVGFVAGAEVDEVVG
jgi:hypothetical protein